MKEKWRGQEFCIFALVSAVGGFVGSPLLAGTEIVDPFPKPEKPANLTWEQYYLAFPSTNLASRLGTNSWVFVDTWKFSGPYTARQANVVEAAILHGKRSYGYLSWQECRPYRLEAEPRGVASNRVYFGLARIRSAVEQDVWLAVGYEADTTVWINPDARGPLDQGIHFSRPNKSSPGWWPIMRAFRITLRKGVNDLFFSMKVEGQRSRISCMLQGYPERAKMPHLPGAGAAQATNSGH